MLDVIYARLGRLNTSEAQFVDLARFHDTMSMVMDDSDPSGLCFLALFIRECDNDLRQIEQSLLDRMVISKTCHKWIGRCAQLGLIGLEKRGRIMQAQAKGAADTQTLRESLAAMSDDLEQIRVALQYMNIY